MHECIFSPGFYKFLISNPPPPGGAREEIELLRRFRNLINRKGKKEENHNETIGKKEGKKGENKFVGKWKAKNYY